MNSARDCIEGCSGKSGDSCFTGCVNVHWPGATFEDAEDDDVVVTSEIVAPTSKDKVIVPTIKPVATPTTTAGPVDDILPYLISFFGGMIPTQQGVIPGQPSTLPTGLSGLPSQMQSSDIPSQIQSGDISSQMQPSGIPTVPLSDFPINTLGPSLMTSKLYIKILPRIIY